MLVAQNMYWLSSGQQKSKSTFSSFQISKKVSKIQKEVQVPSTIKHQGVQTDVPGTVDVDKVK